MQPPVATPPPNQPTSRKNRTKAQLSFYLQISPRQIEHWMAARKIPFLRLGRKCVRFDFDAVDRALMRFEVKAINAEEGQ